MNITSGKICTSQKVVVYGPEGIGKSTFASKFPDPLFIDTEGSTKRLDVKRFDKPTSWEMLIYQVNYVISNKPCKTLIIDTIDWAEQLCIESICAKYQKNGIEDFGYGNGYVYEKEAFGRFLNLLTEVVDAGINVVLTAHAIIRKFEQPDELGSYDRWELKLGKKTTNLISPLVKEWADMVLFSNYKTFSVATDKDGKKHKAQGGQRVMYTSHHPCWDAKNRDGLPDEIAMDYEEIRNVIEQGDINEWEKGNKKTLLVLPTGTGKTIVFAKTAEECVSRGERVLILAHRGELLDQAADKIKKSTGLICAKEKAEDTCLGSWYRITVGSVQSLMREKRLSQFPTDYFNDIIIDEAHHCISDGYQRVLEHFDNANVLGVTATPDRGDMKDLGQVFDSLAYEYTLPKAIKEGYLTPIKAFTIPLTLDLSGVSTQAGDFKASDIDTALDPYLYQIADEMVKNCADRKTVVFLPLIKTSEKFRNILNSKGFHAAEVNGNSEDHAEILEDFDKGKYNVLCNSMLLTEGWDCPSVDCVIVLRPTKVRGLYCQMVGRGTRLSPGKENLLLLDFLWHTERHELCRPAHLICQNKEVADKMTENINQACCPVDIEEAEQKATEDVVTQREEALAQQLSEMRKRKRKLVDPLQYEMSIQAEDLSGYVPAFGWEMSPPSQKQISALEKLGIFPDEIDNAGKATKLLEKLDLRRNAGLTTPKQIRFLESRGFQHVGTWQFESAKKLIDRIAANGWRIPNGITPSTYIGD